MSNRIVFAAAGSGKTELIVREALKEPQRRILITTYTNGNAEQIVERICECTGTLPSNVQVLTWFQFLLRDGIKPYQSVIVRPCYVRSINFKAERPKYVKRSDTLRYYFDSSSNVYGDVVADLTCEINARSGGCTVRRLDTIFDAIFIDEFQDLVGYDLDFVDMLFSSPISVTVVGDPRQFTYATNKSNRNSQYRGAGLIKWAKRRQNSGKAILVTLSHSYRCNQAICDFADGLFPNADRTISMNTDVTYHEGIFLVHEDDVQAYVREFHPTLLRWNKSSWGAKASGLVTVNIGAMKGCTFSRILIFPTKPMLKYLQTASLSDAGDREKFYVAVTRARHSVAFVVPSRSFTSWAAVMW